MPLRDKVSRERALREVILLKRLKHKNITTLVDIIINQAAINPMVSFFKFKATFLNIYENKFEPVYQSF